MIEYLLVMGVAAVAIVVGALLAPYRPSAADARALATGRSAAFTGYPHRAMTGPCPHWAKTLEQPPEPKDVCERCVEIGTQWVHLRQCLVCGKTLCCDDSPMRHTTEHCVGENHPIMRSAEPGENWAWCYPDEFAFIPGPDGWEIA